MTLSKTIYLKSLGCAKNQVDAEIMLSRFIKAGLKPVSDPEKAEIIIVNTCGFIEPAINESIDAVLELAEYKKKGLCKKLIISGCLPERFKEDIIEAIPEADIFLGAGILDSIKNIAENIDSIPKKNFPDQNLGGFYLPIERDAAKHGTAAYIKIAEGCDKVCTYCIIPKIRGKYRSREIDDICAEAEILSKNGVREIILIAQETSCYGKDLGNYVSLSTLLKKLADKMAKTADKTADKIMIRVLYCHPESIDEKLIKTITQTDNICSYFDIPVQHSSDSILKKMGRKYKKDDLLKLFDKIRKYSPDAALRTTFIVGFPQETEKDFQEVYDFVEDIEFDHLGAFVYSDAEDIFSHKLHNHIDKKTAEKRRDIIMKLQQQISYNKNQNHIGKKYKALIEKKDKEIYIGRTWFQAPEIDGITFIEAENLKIGDFADIVVTDALHYDIIGKPL
jgi:ribosomal protein S12 methylthiotransferase